jgi:hypothetical protein
MCVLQPKDASLVPQSCEISDGGGDLFVLVWERLMRVHALHVSSAGSLQYSNATPGHPIVCAKDSECQLGIDGFTCISGLCQQASKALATGDVIALCQDGIAWPSTCPYISNLTFAQRMVEIAANCGTNTTCANVPADCRQAGPLTGVDGGDLLDTGSAPETGGATDARSATDATGIKSDVGDLVDAPRSPDMGTVPDTGRSSDVSVAVDTSIVFDVGGALDASNNLDASAVPDGGAAEDADHG